MESMTTESLLEQHSRLCTEAYRIMQRKNADYGGNDGRSPFRNFDLAPSLGLATREVGIMLRLSDKIQRLSGFLARGDGSFSCSEESFDDTVLDAINYLVLLSASRKDTKQ